jgi:hypothetical protein
MLKNNWGQTALELASRFWYFDVVKLLEEYMALWPLVVQAEMKNKQRSSKTTLPMDIIRHVKTYLFGQHKKSRKQIHRKSRRRISRQRTRRRISRRNRKIKSRKQIRRRINRRRRISRQKMKISYKANNITKDTIEYKFYNENKELSFKDATKLLHDNNNFRLLCVQLFRVVPFDYYMFGLTKIRTPHDYTKQFIMYFKNEPKFKGMRTDPIAFLEKFQYIEEEPEDGTHHWSLFLNLSGDALLLVPNMPKNKNDYFKYRDISSYIKNTSDANINKMLQFIGARLTQIKAPVYVNTHGFGVPWLHIRFDTSPKYCYWYS